MNSQPKPKITILSLLVIFLSLTLYAGEKRAEIDVSALPDGVSIYQLDNGMQVLLIENPALPMVGVNVVVKVGSAYENFASSGMSHILEHLLFNGTTSRKQKELYDAVDRIGGYNNANTSDYFTNYMMVTPGEHIRQGMDIQADMLFNSVLPEHKFEKEKGIVLEEIAKSLAEPREQLERNSAAVLYKGHALSLPTLGTYATIQNMDRDEVFEFYKNSYVPNNMLMSVIGNFKTVEMRGMIDEIYGIYAPGQVVRPNNPEWGTGFNKAALNSPGINSRFYRFYDGSDYKLQLYYPLEQQTASEYYELLDLFFEKELSTFNDKLKSAFPEAFKNIKIRALENPLATYLKIDLTFKKKADFNKAAQMVSALMDEMTITFSEDFITTQINKARTSFLKNIEKPHMFGIYNAHKFAIGGIGTVLSSYSGYGYKMVLPQVTSLRFNKSGFAVILHSPSTVEGGKKSEIRAGVKTQLFNGSEGQPDVIAVQNVSSRLAAFHFMFKHKAQLEMKYGEDAAKVLHDMFGQYLKSEKIQKEANRFGLAVTVNDNPWIPMDDIYMHADYGYIRIEGLADDMTALTTFIKKKMTNFKPTRAGFEKVSAKLGGGSPMMMGRKDTKKMFTALYESAIYEENKFAQKPRLTFENIKKFASEYFQPVNMIIALVAPQDIMEQQYYFADFKGGEQIDGPAYERGFKLAESPVLIEKEGGAEQAYLFYGFIKALDKGDRAALKALSLVLGDRIVFDIREKQGMAYRMRAGIILNGDKALFRINMGTRPKNVEKLIPQFPKLFTENYLKDISAAELEKSVNMYLGRMMFRRLASINQAYYLSNSLYLHGDIAYDKNGLDALKTVTLTDLQRVAKKYLIAENPIQVYVK